MVNKVTENFWNEIIIVNYCQLIRKKKEERCTLSKKYPLFDISINVIKYDDSYYKLFYFILFSYECEGKHRKESDEKVE